MCKNTKDFWKLYLFPISFSNFNRGECAQNPSLKAIGMNIIGSYTFTQTVVHKIMISAIIAQLLVDIDFIRVGGTLFNEYDSCGLLSHDSLSNIVAKKHPYIHKNCFLGS